MRYAIFIRLFFLGLTLTTGCDRPEAIKPSGITIKVGVIGPFPARIVPWAKTASGEYEP